MTVIDRISESLAHVAAWLFFATGLMLGWEVAARYIFTAPTIWAEELSRLLLVWGTFAGAAALVHRRAHIRVTVVTDLLPRPARTVLEVLSLLVIAAFGLAVAITGFEVMWDSLSRGRTTGSMLDLPLFWSQAAVPAGGGLLVLQSLVEAFRTDARGAPPPDHGTPSEPLP
ncbi:MAG: TRAP transporter small permease [Alphaproteobacteria bacterium]|nr:MAG: TRAP transporter small permease [Alphaproteobacteria bacterium]